MLCLLFCFFMAAVGVGGIPLWSGYISKTLLHESIVEYIEILSVQGGAGEGWLIFPEGAALIRGTGWKMGFMEQRGRQKNGPFFCRP